MRRNWEVYAGVFLVSAALLLLEISLTKIFSVVLWYHFGFLAISVSLLGFSLAGVYLAFSPNLLTRSPSTVLWRGALLSAVAVVVAFLLVTHSQFDTHAIVREKGEVFLLVLFLELMAPFFCFGVCISAAVTLHRDDIARLYFANLFGSGVGCLLAIWSLDHMTGQQAVLVAATLAAAGSACFAIRVSVWRVAAAVALAGGIAALAPEPVSEALFKLLPPRSKPLYGVPPASIEYSNWSSLSKVDIFDIGRGDLGLWGLDGAFQRQGGVLPFRKGIVIDAWAITSITQFDGDLTKLKVLEWLPATLVHRLRRGVDMVCLGAGGGLDVLSGIYFGQKSITGVDINRLIVDQMRTKYDEFSGHLYTNPTVTKGIDGITPPDYRPKVDVVVAEGRSFLERVPDRSYDIIQLSGVDTHSTTEAGAFTLSENYLYTLEAFEAYFRKLRPNGIITLTRWYVATPGRPDVPQHGPRLFVLAYEALKRHGVSQPEKGIAFLNKGLFTVMLLKTEPFSAEELQTIESHSETYGLTQLFLPNKSIPTFDVAGVTTPNYFERYVGAEDKSRFIRNYPYDISPPTDDKPFFFELSRWGTILEHDSFFNVLGGITAQGVLFILVVILVLSSVVFLILPLRVLTRRGVIAGGGWRMLTYFGALGLGYISIEIPLSQQFILFLGRPVYALSVVLFSMLVCSGIGSLLTSRVKGDPGRTASRLILAVALLAALTTVLVRPMFHSFLDWPLTLRILLSVLLLAPVGVLMGMPFPLGIRALQQREPRAIPWAWAVNGYTSVLGSALAVVFGMAFGFRVVLIGAIVTYLIGAVAIRGFAAIGARSVDATILR